MSRVWQAICVLMAAGGCASGGSTSLVEGSNYVEGRNKIPLGRQCESPGQVADSVLRALEFPVVTAQRLLVETDYRSGPNRAPARGDFLTRFSNSVNAANARRDTGFKVRLEFVAPSRVRSTEHAYDVVWQFTTRSGRSEHVATPTTGSMLQNMMRSSLAAQGRAPSGPDASWYYTDIDAIVRALQQICGAGR